MALESFSGICLMESVLQVDRTEGIIRRVKILGRTSPNKGGVRYSDQAFRDGVKLYEGLRVNIDHPPRDNPGKERAYQDGFGDLRNITTVLEGGDKKEGVFGDLHYNRHHPLADKCAEDAERFPGTFGLSHNADGDLSGDYGNRIVESLNTARSVDVVSRPATNEGLFESEEPMAKTKTVRRILDSAPASKKKSRLVHLMEQDPLAVPPEMAVDIGEEGINPDEEIDKAFEQAAVAVVKNAEIGPEETGKKVTEILKAKEDMMSTGDESDLSDVTKPSDSEPVSESVRKELAEFRKERAEFAAEKLLESNNIESTPVRVRALVETKDQSIKDELLELWPKKTLPGRRPRTSQSVLESEEEKIEQPSWAK